MRRMRRAKGVSMQGAAGVPIRRWLLLAALACTLAACDVLGVGFTPIKDIVAAPARFEGEEVKVTGEVARVTQVPFVEVKAYVLRANGAELAVTTEGAPPNVGDKVSVRGKVLNTAIVGGGRGGGGPPRGPPGLAGGGPGPRARG